MVPMFRGFLWKKDPLEQYIPMWVPPLEPIFVIYRKQFAFWDTCHGYYAFSKKKIIDCPQIASVQRPQYSTKSLWTVIIGMT